MAEGLGGGGGLFWEGKREIHGERSWCYSCSSEDILTIRGCGRRMGGECGGGVAVGGGGAEGGWMLGGGVVVVVLTVVLHVCTFFLFVLQSFLVE